MFEDDRNRVFWVIVIAVGSIIGIILTLLGPYVIHITLFQHTNNFLVSTPFFSHILVGIATILLCIGGTLMLAERKVLKAGGILLLISSLVFLYSGFTNYSIFSTEDITVREPFSKTVYEYEDIESVVIRNSANQGGLEVITEFDIAFNDSKYITVRVNRSMESWRFNRLRNHIQQAGVNIETVEETE